MFEILFPVGFMVIFVVAFVSMVKATAKKNADKTDNGTQNNVVDGNGRTQAQNDYIASLRKRAAERKVATQQNISVVHDDCQAEADASTHEHVGKEEHYEPIVGSLGGESTEGCPGLDGVRLIEHDIAYDSEDGKKHFDRAKLARAMILGDVLSQPRYKGPRKR